MLYSQQFTALLDANTLYPAPLRDFLLRLAASELYKPLWSDKIQEEWIRNLLVNRPDLTRENLERTKAAMEAAFPDANVDGYQSLIEGLQLPDPGDRHVLAAAIKGRADAIVTFNLKDFPADRLTSLDIEAIHPDTFVSQMIELDRPKVQETLHKLVNSLKNPPKSLEDVLKTLDNCGLHDSVALLKGIGPASATAG